MVLKKLCFILFIIFNLSEKCSSEVDNISGRIVNGTPAYRSFDYHAHLTMQWGNQTAREGSGVVINLRIILTAAQNLDGFDEFMAGVGSLNRTQLVWFRAETYTVLPDYSSLRLENNLGFLIFARNTFRIENVSPIALLPPRGDILQPLENEEGTISGFGHITRDGVLPDFLQVTFQRVTTEENCLSIYPVSHGHNFCSRDIVKNSQICSGDQGSAFTTVDRGQMFLTGITSRSDCNSTFPALYVRIAPYRDIINFFVSMFN